MSLALAADPAARDALAILAHIYLRFDRPAEAAALFAALAVLDPQPGWARRGLCIARFRAGDYPAAAAEAESLLRDAGLDDEARLPLLHVAAMACWRMGREEEGRRWREAASAAMAVMVQKPGPARPPTGRGG